MADETRDILVRFSPWSGDDFPGECVAVLADDDDMVKDFTEGHYSDATDFSFEIGAATHGGKRSSSLSPGATKSLEQTNPNIVAALGAAESGSVDTYHKFLTGAATVEYPMDLQPVTLTKMVDASSLPIIDSLSKNYTLSSIKIVKRRGVGRNRLYGYMSFLFEQVLFTEVSWQEDKVVSEDCTFICRKATVTYYPQLDDGSLHNTSMDSTQPSRSWTMKSATSATE